MESRMANKQNLDTKFFKCITFTVFLVLTICCFWSGKIMYEQLTTTNKTIDAWASLLNNITNNTSIINSFFAAILAITLVIGKYYDKNVIKWNLSPLIIGGILCGANVLFSSAASMGLLINATKDLGLYLSWIAVSNFLIGWLLLYSVVINMGYLVKYIKQNIASH